MKIFILFFLIQASFMFAETKVIEKDLSLLKIDKKNFQNIEPTKPVVESKVTREKISVSCKDSMGKEFKKGDVGYDTCLSGIGTQHDLNKLNSGLNKKDKKAGNSGNLNFKFGD